MSAGDIALGVPVHHDMG